MFFILIKHTFTLIKKIILQMKSNDFFFKLRNEMKVLSNQHCCNVIKWLITWFNNPFHHIDNWIQNGILLNNIKILSRKEISCNRPIIYSIKENKSPSTRTLFEFNDVIHWIILYSFKISMHCSTHELKLVVQFHNSSCETVTLRENSPVCQQNLPGELLFRS
jgi:hypothetical protein